MQPAAQSNEQIRRPNHAQATMASRSASFDTRTRSEQDSWVEISSQPSSSSLSSAGGDEVVTTGLRVQQPTHRRRSLRPTRPSHLTILQRQSSSAGGASSQEEYEDSESESDRVMSSSNEGPVLPGPFTSSRVAPWVEDAAVPASEDEDDDEENRTAINYPIRNDQCFTPQPNAFSRPPSSQIRNNSQHAPGSYFPTSERRESRPALRQSSSSQQSHLPQNILSPSYDAAAQHDEALRTSLSTLLSCAAAARNLGKPKPKQTEPTPARPTRMEPMSLRLLPESALPSAATAAAATAFSPPQFQEPTFNPTLRRKSTSTSTSSVAPKEHKRKAGRSTSRRALKKARHSSSSSSSEEFVSPTLLTWVVSAGVVVFLSALSFSAGYGLGKEAGRLEAGGVGVLGAGDEQVRSCAREAGRSGLGLRRSLARSAVQV